MNWKKYSAFWLFIGIIYLIFFIAYSASLVGTYSQPHIYDISLPILLFITLTLPLVFGLLAGQNTEKFSFNAIFFFSGFAFVIIITLLGLFSVGTLSELVYYDPWTTPYLLIVFVFPFVVGFLAGLVKK